MYSSLSLRLRRARKTWWKSLTSRIRINLNKTKRSSSSSSSSSSLSRHPKAAMAVAASWPHKFFLRKQIRRRWPQRRRRILSGAAAPPVYLDKLFNEQPPVLAAEQQKPGKLVSLDDRDRRVSFDRTARAEPGGEASPLRGIDERAEAFIARFRAEMELQEMLARRGL